MNNIVIIQDLEAELANIEKSHGQQNFPLVRDLGPKEGLPKDMIFWFYEIPTETRAKQLCTTAFNENRGTWGHVLIEEVCEFVGARSVAHQREELVQVMAVAASAIQYIDRNFSHLLSRRE